MIHGSRQVSFLRTWAGSEQVNEKIPVWYIIWFPYIYYNLYIYTLSHTHIYIYTWINAPPLTSTGITAAADRHLFSTDIASLGHRVLQGEMSRLFWSRSQRDMTRVTVTWCIILNRNMDEIWVNLEISIYIEREFYRTDKLRWTQIWFLGPQHPQVAGDLSSHVNDTCLPLNHRNDE